MALPAGGLAWDIGRHPGAGLSELFEISKQKRNNPVKQRKTQHFPQKKDPKYYDFTTQG